MKCFVVVLRFAAPVFFVVGALHLWLGLGADALLGARVPAEALADPALNSQNRFFGVAFTLYGVVLLISSGNLAKYQAILRAALWVFFAGGVARLVSIASHGLPPPMVLVLLSSELFLPPLLLSWLGRVLREQ